MAVYIKRLSDFNPQILCFQRASKQSILTSSSITKAATMKLITAASLFAVAAQAHC